MTRTSKITTWSLLAALAAMTAAPVLANPDSQQKNKNQWRNLGIAGAVIGGYGLLKGDKTATLLGAAGAAYSANRYETDRRHQSQDNSNGRRYYRTYGWRAPVSGNNGYNNNDYNNRDNNGYSNRGYGNNSGYDNSQYNSGQYDDRQYNNGDNNNSDNGWARTRKHHGKGWYKNHGSQDENRNNGDRDHGDRD